MKVSFEELPLRLKRKIFSLLQVRLSYKGEPHETEDILKILLRTKKTRKVWRSKPYYYMKAIDKHRERGGLKAIYNCDLTLSTGGDIVNLRKS